MANVYIPDEAKKKLDELSELENRAISDEVTYLIEKRLTELSNE